MRKYASLYNQIDDRAFVIFTDEISKDKWEVLTEVDSEDTARLIAEKMNKVL